MINILTLILLNIIYFLCNIYPKHIIEINSPLSVFNIIFNSLFYLLFSFFLVVSLNKNKNFFSGKIFASFEKITQKIQLKRIFLIFLIQIFFDVFTVFLNFVINKNVLYVSDFATVLIWITSYIVCAKKEQNIFFKGKFYIVIISFLVLLVITTYCNFNILEQYTITLNKYNTVSSSVVKSINNLDFIYQVKNFFLDTVSGLILLTLHRTFNNFNLAKVKWVKIKEKIARKIICSGLLIFISLLLVYFKSLIYAPNCIKGINITNSNTKEYISSNLFSANTETIKIKRADGKLLEKTVFQKTHNQLLYNGNIILEYISNDDKNAFTYYKDNNQIGLKNCFEKISDEIEFYLYKNEVICFLNEGTPVVVLPNGTYQEYNANLAIIYKNLIRNNNWEFFEQGSEYLIKYDKEFIIPYLERFSRDEFSEHELNKLTDYNIRKGYIQYISKGLIEKTGDGSVS